MTVSGMQILDTVKGQNNVLDKTRLGGLLPSLIRDKKVRRDIFLHYLMQGKVKNNNSTLDSILSIIDVALA